MSGKLTVEQVIKATYAHSIHADCADADWQAIADELNATLGGDTEPENADSRELILTDLEKKTREWHDYDGNFMRIYSDVAYAQMKELLNRQAAITRRETLLENPLHNNPYVGLVRGKRWERKESSDYYCGKCGWKVTDHDSYCPECGGALHRAPNQPNWTFLDVKFCPYCGEKVGE